MNLVSLAVVFLLCKSLCARTVESVEDAAIIARRLLDKSKTSIATMATVYPADDPSLPSYPFSLQEYYASCYHNGSLSLLFFPIGRHGQNILHSGSHLASISVTDDVPNAGAPRVSLIGNITIYMNNTIPHVESIESCYLEKHPDAAGWLPNKGKSFHFSYWARFDPHSVYFVGGFGGIHYIGYIPLSLYQAAQQNGTRVKNSFLTQQ